MALPFLDLDGLNDLFRFSASQIDVQQPVLHLRLAHFHTIGQYKLTSS